MLPFADALLDDFLVAENSPNQSEIDSPVLTAERASPIGSPKRNQSNSNYNLTSPSLDGGHNIHSSGGMGYFIPFFFL